MKSLYDIQQSACGFATLADLCAATGGRRAACGFALLADIRDSELKAVRVVALTAHAMAGDRDRAMAAGFDGYITKPVDIRGFPDQIARALAGEAVTQ